MENKQMSTTEAGNEKPRLFMAPVEWYGGRTALKGSVEPQLTVNNSDTGSNEQVALPVYEVPVYDEFRE